MAYHITFEYFYGYQKMLRYGTFLSKFSQRFINLIDLFMSKTICDRQTSKEELKKMRKTNCANRRLNAK